MGKVFLSYSTVDKPFVNWLVGKLIKEDIDIWYDDLEINAGDSIKEKISKGIEASSVFLIILSKSSVKSRWVNYELNDALIYRAQKKGIKIVPLLMDNETIIPYSLSMVQYVDFRNNKESSLKELVTYLHSTEKAHIPNWELLSPKSFEDMVYDLLHKIGLKDIIRNASSRDHGFDFVGYYSTDTDHTPKKEKWIIESKLYKNAKVSVQTIASLYGIAKLSAADKIVIATNSSLTSSALNFIKESIKDIKVQIWDEITLADLIMKFSDVQNKFFKADNTVDDMVVTIYDKELITVQNYINRLKSCPEGSMGWKEYEDICIEILNHLFVPPLKEPKIQSRTESGIDIRDAVYPNRGNHENWGFIRNDYEAKYIIFEFKNYSLKENGIDIDKHVVNQVRNYLKHTIGRIGFVCSKKKPTPSAFEARKQAFIEDKKLILFLNNEHLIDMLMKKYKNEEPSDVIVDMIDEFNINFG